MIATSQHTTLSIGQLHILEMMNRCRTEESLRQLKKLLFDFYSKEAVAEADRLTVYGKQELSMKVKSRSGVRNTCALPTFMQNEKDCPGYQLPTDVRFIQESVSQSVDGICGRKGGMVCLNRNSL